MLQIGKHASVKFIYSVFITYDNDGARSCFDICVQNQVNAKGCEGRRQC